MIDLSDLFDDETPSSKWRTNFNRVRRWLKDLKYEVRAIFKPYNVIKIQNLPRTWTDRDDVLFHAMFQIFIDYIEREHPFAPWDKRYELKGRYTDHAEMVKFVEENYGPNRGKSAGDLDDSYYENAYLVYTELLWIYKWYKDKKWVLDESTEYTWEIQEAHDKKCDDMLHRLVAWRHHFWT